MADYFAIRGKQGGLILGTGGDNSDGSRGIFYEVLCDSGESVKIDQYLGLF